MLVLNEIVNVDQIRSILENFSGEKQLLELKMYFLQYHDELKEIGADPSSLAWQIYTKRVKLGEKIS
tara:strand:+ start:452 stop:652 length:201 start_codon:yes stop_codon:yes gene_type:complete